MENQGQQFQMNNDNSILKQDCLALLNKLIQTPSFSKEEQHTAALIAKFFSERMIETTWVGNNIIARNKFFDEQKPTILLNSHHDTVRPNPGYTRDPFTATVENGKIYGLGSNDAGGSLVALIAVFLFFYQRQDLKYNLIID